MPINPYNPRSLVFLDARYVRLNPTASQTITGQTLQIDVPTATSEALILKTTDDDTTKNLLEVQDSSGANLVEIDSSGNVGIGGDPITQLNLISGSKFVQATSTVTNPRISLSDGTSITKMQVIAASGTGFFGTETSHSFVIITNNTEKIRINSAGNVLINGFGSANTGLIIKGASSQSANLFEVQDSSSNKLTQVGADGFTSMSRFTAETSTGSSVFEIIKRTSGIPAAGFGVGFIMSADSNGAESRTHFLFNTSWVDATDATRKTRVNLFIYDTVARQAIRMEADGSQPLVAIGGATVDSLTSLKVQAPGATYIPLVVKGASSQSANLQEWQDSGGNVLVNVEADGDLDMNENTIKNFGQLAMKGSVEATISSGAITITEGHIKVDTEADDPNDDLDTINSTQSGEILFLLPADDTRTVRIRHGVGNIFLKHQVESKSFSFASPAGSSGTFYAGGYYNWATADANLTQASLSVTHSAANSASACHIGIVAGGAGVVDTGVVKLTVSGTTIDDNGVRATSQTVILVADITTLSANQYIETTEKWIGQVTIALATASGSPVNFSLDANYGCSKYEDFGNQAFTVNVLECVGRAGANDTGFNLRLFHHSSAGWTYAATGFVPGGTVLANMNTDYSTEQDLVNGESFAYKRVNLNTDIVGDDSEGLVLEVTTGANKAVEVMDIHFGVHTAPNFAYLATTKQHLIFMKHGGNWLEL